ncbi:MAG: GbsR/MarR family transcriptional regulator [Burkholderiales bacterium]
MADQAGLHPIAEKFVLHWGEMGSRWGVNRTVAQIHALLFLSDRPLHAEEIADTLGIARSNVSTSLKELQSWNLAQITHLMGDRRDHFTTLKDIQEIFRVVIDGKKKREIDPTITVLRECVLAADDKVPAHIRARIESTLAFSELVTEWYDEMKSMPPKSWLSLMKMGNKVQSLLRRTA